VAQAPVVAVVGMNALKRDLVKLAGDKGPINTLFVQAGVAALAPVAAATRAALPHDTGRLAGDVRVTGTRTGGTLRMGRASVRYAGWVEFGGTRRRPHESERDYEATGRYMFPAARALATVTQQRYTDALTKAIDVYPWTNESTDGTAVHD
jgi:hypothetical protein